MSNANSGAPRSAPRRSARTRRGGFERNRLALDGPAVGTYNIGDRRQSAMKNLIARFVREEEGQDIIEYALLAAFISISGYTILSSIGTSVNSIYTTVNPAVDSANTAASS
jgi:pilus assembly protein Flp/PilA